RPQASLVGFPLPTSHRAPRHLFSRQPPNPCFHAILFPAAPPECPEQACLSGGHSESGSHSKSPEPVCARQSHDPVSCCLSGRAPDPSSLFSHAGQPHTGSAPRPPASRAAQLPPPSQPAPQASRRVGPAKNRKAPPPPP